jgi:heat shock protein HtpX
MAVSAPLVFIALEVTVVLVAVGIGSATRRRRQVQSAVSVQLPDGESVTFEASRRRRLPDNRRLQLNALIFVGFGIWAAILIVHGEAVLGSIAVFVFLELALAVFRVATITGGTVTDDLAVTRVAVLLNELCARAACPVPRVMLRDDTVRAAAVRQLRKQTTLVISRTFVNRVDDQALKATLAHEVIHIVRDDLEAARGRAFAAVVVAAVLGGASAVVVHLPGVEGMPIWIAAGVIGVMATNVALSPTNRPLELRADLEGARLAGDPEALARALAQAQSLSNETRLRMFGRPPWCWLFSPLSWRMPSHPPMKKRIARLKALT